MPAAKPIYDLVVLLDPAAPPEERTKTLDDIRSQVKAGGEILLEQDWGDRALAYPIDHREQAEYHLLQLHATGPLIESLDRNLRIADGVVRHRIIKLAPGTPAAPEHIARVTPASAAAAEAAPAVEAAPEPEPVAAEGAVEPEAAAPEPEPDAEAAPAPEPEPEPAAEAEAEPAAEPAAS